MKVETRRYSGIPVSPGIAVGEVHLYAEGEIHVSQVRIPPDACEAEYARFLAARDSAAEQVTRLRTRVSESIGETFGGILAAQVAILNDPQLTVSVRDQIHHERRSAAWALELVVEGYLKRFDAIEDAYLRERATDLMDVARRLQRLLAAQETAEERLRLPGQDWIVVAHALGPSDAAMLADRGVAGLVTDTGGVTSHTAILAHALGVPAVAGLRNLSRQVRAGETILIDGNDGEVVLVPSDAQRERALERSLAPPVLDADDGDPRRVTRDGEAFVVRANIEFTRELEFALSAGAEGVGLYRSEFLFLARAPELPTEEEHYQTYRRILEAAAPHPAVIRTLDLGGEKYFHALTGQDPDPTLGLRAIRLCLSRPDLFLPQLRGLVRAAVHGDLRVLVPLVTDPDEIRTVRSMLNEQAATLSAEGVSARGQLPVGAMIEVPAAAASADQLCEVCDFLSIGTNDLVQFAMAADRGNASVAHLYQPFHPGLVRLMRWTLDAAQERGVPIAICGQIAGDPRSVERLLRLGLREFSVEPRSLSSVVRALRQSTARAEPSHTSTPPRSIGSTAGAHAPREAAGSDLAASGVPESVLSDPCLSEPGLSEPGLAGPASTERPSAGQVSTGLARTGEIPSSAVVAPPGAQSRAERTASPPKSASKAIRTYRIVR